MQAVARDHAKGGETVASGRAARSPTRMFKELQKAKIEQVEVTPQRPGRRLLAADVVDMATGEVLLEANQELTADRRWRS